MFITEPVVARTPLFKAWVPNYILATFRACSTELLFDSCGVFLEYAKIKQAKTNALLTEWRKGTK